MSKETYKAYFRQRINEKFVGTESNVQNTNKNPPPAAPTLNKRKRMGVGSNFISGLRPATARPATPQTDRPVQAYYNHISALNKNDPYGLQRGVASSTPTSEEQAEIDKNKAKTPPV